MESRAVFFSWHCFYSSYAWWFHDLPRSCLSSLNDSPYGVPLVKKRTDPVGWKKDPWNWVGFEKNILSDVATSVCFWFWCFLFFLWNRVFPPLPSFFSRLLGVFPLFPMSGHPKKKAAGQDESLVRKVSLETKSMMLRWPVLSDGFSWDWYRPSSSNDW